MNLPPLIEVPTEAEPKKVSTEFVFSHSTSKRVAALRKTAKKIGVKNLNIDAHLEPALIDILNQAETQLTKLEADNKAAADRKSAAAKENRTLDKAKKNPRSLYGDQIKFSPPNDKHSSIESANEKITVIVERLSAAEIKFNEVELNTGLKDVYVDWAKSTVAKKIVADVLNATDDKDKKPTLDDSRENPRSIYGPVLSFIPGNDIAIINDMARSLAEKLDTQGIERTAIVLDNGMGDVLAEYSDQNIKIIALQVINQYSTPEVPA